MKSKKLILVSLGLLLVITGAYLALPPTKRVQETALALPTPTPTPEVSLKNTYLNKTWGYSIKYPQNWTISTRNPEPEEEKNSVLISSPSDKNTVGSFFIAVATPAPKNPKTAFEKEKQFGAILETISQKAFTFKGQPAFQAVVRYSQAGYPRGQIRIINYISSQNQLFKTTYFETHQDQKNLNLENWQLLKTLEKIFNSLSLPS